jgi:hypothetical protein
MDGELPFRFLDLPAELRLMVFENLPISEASCQIDLRRNFGRRNFDTRNFVLVWWTIPLPLLATCRYVKEKAQPILRSKMEEISLQRPPRMEIRNTNLDQFLHRFRSEYEYKCVFNYFFYLLSLGWTHEVTASRRDIVPRDVLLYNSGLLRSASEDQQQAMKKFLCQATRHFVATLTASRGTQSQTPIIPTAFLVRILQYSNSAPRSIGGNLAMSDERLDELKDMIGHYCHAWSKWVALELQEDSPDGSVLRKCEIMDDHARRWKCMGRVNYRL